jgi:hypothetical protein
VRHPEPTRFASGAFCFAALILLLAGCADNDHQVVISVPEQRMVVLNQGVPLAYYPVSTSKFGLGDIPGRGYTPLGELEIAGKIGDGLPPGAVLKSRERTGEIVAVDSPGRDPIVTRILWLRGLEARNQNAYGRFIYIHGTPEERNIGRPVSYGCVRMRSRDIIALYDTLGRGAKVFIQDAPLAAAAQPLLAKGLAIAPVPTPAATAVPSLPLAAQQAAMVR